MINFGELVRRGLREPLVHFLIAGCVVFTVASWRGSAIDPQSRSITITAAQVQSLAERWSQTWQRAPTPSEIDGLIRDYIKEEVYYREAKRIGLDEDDFVIRRRLRSKMEYLASAEAESAQPDDAMLQVLLDKQPQKYARDATYSFDQIYLSNASAAKSAATLAALRAGQNWHGMGDRISLPTALNGASTSDIARDFGDNFASALAAQKQGIWVGPIASGFGTHLVRIRVVSLPVKPKLADVRQEVSNDWRDATIKDRENRAYQALLDGYTVRIARP